MKTPFPERVSIPSSFVFLFIFYILSYLLSKTMGCFSGHLMSSASDQKLFCEVCSALNCSFDKFVGEKVVSPSYSSSILAPPLIIFYKNSQKLLKDITLIMKFVTALKIYRLNSARKKLHRAEFRNVSSTELFVQSLYSHGQL